MKFMFPEKFRVGSIMALVALFVSFSFAADNHLKKKADNKQAIAKKTEKQSKDAKKDKRGVKEKVATAKSRKDKKAAAKSKDLAKKDIKSKDDAKKNARSSKDDAKKTAKKDPKKLAEEKRAEAERRRREEERRQAILAEQRRREQAAREARARKVAFERGLKTETLANIANDKTDGEDLNIRRAAVDALAGHAGSVVVMEAQTGKVLTIVNQDWAIRSSIRPCSTIKLVTAAAGLNEGIISKEDGSVRHTSTRRNLDEAIAFSDNAYFQRVGSNLGNTKLVEYGKEFGLGQPTGINVDGESAGRLPYSNNNARIYSHGDDTEVTTLQLAVMVSAITNGGKRVLPRVPRNTVEQAHFQAFYRAKVELPQQNVRRMIPGMMGAAEYGTAHRSMNQSLGVAGKTGSCIDKGSWVGLFTSVAPIETPKYSVAVITRGQSERGKYAAAVAAKIYNVLSPQITRTDRNLAQTEFHLRPRTPIDARINPSLTDAEDEDEMDASAAGADEAEILPDNRNIIVVPSAPRNMGDKPMPKLVKKTADSKPTFPPVVITFDKDQTGKKRERIVRPD